MATLKEALWILLVSLLVPGMADGTSTPSFMAAYENNITVSPSGSDNQTCLNGETPCQTLDYPLQPGNLKNSTKVTILSGSYNLSTAFSFAWLEDFALFSASDEVAVHCENDTGLSFQKSKNLLFRGLVFEGCGSLHESTTGSAWINFNRAKFKAGLFLAACSNLSVQNCTFRGSPGIAVNLYDVGGIVDFSHSWFERNGPDTRKRNYTIGIAEAGGGLYIEFTAQGYDASGVNFPVKNSNYSVSDCHFIQNHAPQPRYENYTVMNITGNRHSPFGRGGGISVFLMGTTEGNTVLIDRCVFQENNASWGGGVFFELHKQAQNTTLKIRNSTFLKNWVRLGGGGTRTGSITTESSQVLKANKIFYENCTFIENRAIFGGGVSHYGPTYLPANNNDQRQVYFIDCIWNGNRATAGSALGLNVLSESQIRVHPLVPFYVTLEMCSIQNNRIIQTEDFVVHGYGALYTNAAHLIFKGDVTFENNTNMTALLLDNAFVYVHNKTVFRNNSGEFGGAIALYGESRIITWNGSELLFESNHARGMGGAIYVRAPGPPMAPFKTRYLAIHECFLAFESLTQNAVEQWNTKITFKNNSAFEGTGNSVYATTLQSCYKHNETRENNQALHWPNVVNFIAGSSQTSEISTDPVSLEIDQHDWQHLSPSQLFNLSVRLTDERSQRSPGTVEIRITQPDPGCDVKLDVPSSLFIVQKNGLIVGLKFTGKQDCGFMVQLKSPPGQQFLQPAPFSVSLRSCHAGFTMGKDNNKTCTCMDKLKHRGISRCEDGKSVYLKKGYWFGKVGKTGHYDTYPCPKHYCNKAFMINEYTECQDEDPTDEFLYDNTTMCAENRAGTLCGSCKEGYSVHLGDEVCFSPCRTSINVWVFGSAFFIGALVIVLFLLLIPHLDIFVSYLNAILFSFQVMDVLIIERDRLDGVIAGVISIAHWKSPTPGFPFFCGMTDIIKLGINYILPFYILLLLLVLMLVAKRCRNVYFGENVFPAFCALIVLCYTNVTDITFNIFDYVQLGGKSVLLLDGDIDFHEDWKKHLVLTVIAGLWSVFFILPVPIILLFRPGFIEQNCRFLSNICNAFSRCYREDYEGFAAFYFICRIILSVLSKFMPLGEFLPMKRSILEASTLLMVVFLVCIRPYHDDFSVLNKTDAILLVNLSFITIFSTTLVISSSKEVHCAAWFIVDILCWFPVLVLLYLIIRYRRTLLEKWRQLKTWISTRLPACCNCTCVGEEEDSGILDEPTSTSA